MRSGHDKVNEVVVTIRSDDENEDEDALHGS